MEPKTQPAESGIKIGALAALAGVSKSTIHYYLKLEILHPPQKIGLSRTVFNSSHLRVLRRVNELRKNEKMPLAKIREVIRTEKFQRPEYYSTKEDTASLIRELKTRKKNAKEQNDETKRIQIVDAAITLFAKNGYDKTTLEAIADSLHIAKSTVYLYFENKDHLFMKCIDRLTFIAVPDEVWNDIRKEEHPLKRLQKKATAFQNAFPNYRGILTLIKASISSENIEMAKKAKNALFLMTRRIGKDIRQGIDNGLFREINEDLIAYLILAMGEGLGYRLMLDSQYSNEDAIKIMYDFISNGILRDSSSQIPQPETQLLSGDVTDISGNMTAVSKILFRENSWISVKMGEADVKLYTHRIKKLTFINKELSLWTEITAIDGQTASAVIDGSIHLTGLVNFGEFSIELRNVKSILFTPGGIESNPYQSNRTQ
ncbi:MAG: TetR family transcriptional regulator [Pseudomonadota bacterium]